MPSPRRERARTTRVSEMADFAGVSEQAFRKWMTQPGFPMAPDKSVCLWDLAIWRHRMDSGSEFGEEIAIGDGDSEGLERYRMARAQQEEIKLAKMRGDFIPREDVHTALIETSPILLSAGEQIKRAGGNDLGEILIAAWGEVLKRLESIFGNDRTGREINGDGGAPA